MPLSSDAPPLQAHAHLNAFHAYAHEPTRVIETNHYCAHAPLPASPPSDSSQVRQCILYDSPGPNARLIGVEYMITPDLYATLPSDERKLWHSHVYEVKSGMLVMPFPKSQKGEVPEAVKGKSAQDWEGMETEEMQGVVKLYGKVYHLWQTDRGDELPLGEPQLMTSLTGEGQIDFEKKVGERDRKFEGVDWRHKREIRKRFEEPEVHADADQAWKK